MTAKSTGKSKTPTPKPAAAKNTKPDATKKPLRTSTKAVSKRPAKTQKTAAASIEPKADAVEPEALELSKKELVERMVEQTGMKTGEARRALDATLTVLASGLREGANLAAAPLGKIRIMRQKETANGDLVICRIKLKDPKPASPKTAEPGQDSSDGFTE